MTPLWCSGTEFDCELDFYGFDPCHIYSITTEINIFKLYFEVVVAQRPMRAVNVTTVLW